MKKQYVTVGKRMVVLVWAVFNLTLSLNDSLWVLIPTVYESTFPGITLYIINYHIPVELRSYKSSYD